MNSRSYLFAAILVTSALLRSGPAADWPQWLGPSRNGVTPEVIAPWKQPPTVLWRHEVGNGYSSPIVASGTVIVHAAVAGKDAEVVSAWQAKSGEPVWSDVYSRGAYRSQLGVGPRTTPAVADGKLYTYGITGVLSAYDLKTGKRLWQTNPYETYKISLPRFGVCSSPVVADGRVIVMAGGGSAVVAYDAATGELAWKVLDEPASSASPIVITRGEGDQRQSEIVVQTTLRTVGLSTRDGSVQWEHPLVFQPSGVSPTPLAIGKLLVCTTQDTGTLALDFSGVESGNPRSPWWKQDLTSYFSTGTVGPQGSVIVVTNQSMPLPRADLRCLDLAKGEELWRKDGLGYFHVGVISTGDGKLLLLDDGGYLILAEATREGFKQLAKSAICRGTLSNPSLSDGCVYVRDDKEVIGLQLSPSADVQKRP
jgi:outer membrane protein assembly factor BamB